ASALSPWPTGPRPCREARSFRNGLEKKFALHNPIEATKPPAMPMPSRRGPRQHGQSSAFSGDTAGTARDRNTNVNILISVRNGNAIMHTSRGSGDSIEIRFREIQGLDQFGPKPAGRLLPRRFLSSLAHLRRQPTPGTFSTFFSLPSVTHITSLKSLLL